MDHNSPSNGVSNGDNIRPFDRFHMKVSANALLDVFSVDMTDAELAEFEEAKEATTSLPERTLVLGKLPDSADVNIVMKQFEKDYGHVHRVFQPSRQANEGPAVFFVFFVKSERAKFAEKALSEYRFLKSHVKARICPDQRALTWSSAADLLGLSHNMSGRNSRSSPDSVEQLTGYGDTEDGNWRGQQEASSSRIKGDVRKGDYSLMRLGGGGPPQHGGPLRDNYPTRVLVNSDLVGAVIGRGGEKIKEITSQTTARVDVKRELVPWSQRGSAELSFTPNGPSFSSSGAQQAGPRAQQSQIVFILGNSDCSSQACRLIMEICKKEASENGKQDLNLGLLAEDRFCGRIIGRDGRNLNQIKEKTGATIAISNSPTITALSMEPQIFSLDRIVTMRGTLDAVCQAEEFISEKLRHCHQMEATRVPPYPPSRGMPRGPSGMPYPPMMPNMFPPPPPEYCFGGPPYGGRMGMMRGRNGMGMPRPELIDEVKLDEALYMRVPHVSAGAIIGTDGASIKKIMEETKTYVNVSKVKPDGWSAPPPPPPNYQGPSRAQEAASQRLVTIKGPPNYQTKAQWHIFQRVKSSCRQYDMDMDIQDQDISLWTIVRVPRPLVGRIIGKGGKVVNHIQANTGTIVNLPRDTGGDDHPESEYQSVEVYGCFDSTQLALTRIRALIQQAAHQGSGMMPPGSGLPLPPPHHMAGWNHPSREYVKTKRRPEGYGNYQDRKNRMLDGEGPHSPIEA